jgi:hypothetical protein
MAPGYVDPAEATTGIWATLGEPGAPIDVHCVLAAHDWEPWVPFRAPSLGDVCLSSASGRGCFATGSSVTQGAISSISFTTPSGNGRVLRVIATSTISGQVVEFARLLMVPTTREQCQMLPK